VGPAVIFVIENNGYSMGTSQERSSCTRRKASPPAPKPTRMDWDVCNGENLYAVRACIGRAIERAHERLRPTLLEIKTYRYYGHSVADANAKKYRSKEEIEKYSATTTRSPSGSKSSWPKACSTRKPSPPSTRRRPREEPSPPPNSPRTAPTPTVDDILTDVYWEVDSGTPPGAPARHFFNT
jgi:pyruvate dehydrogenase E1 component alpha subunit